MQNARLGEKAFFLRAQIQHGAFDPGVGMLIVYSFSRLTVTKHVYRLS